MTYCESMAELVEDCADNLEWVEDESGDSELVENADD